MATMTAERQSVLTDRAAAVAKTARPLHNGDVELDSVALLSLLTACSGVRVIALGDRGCVGVRRLAPLLRACRNTTQLSVTLNNTNVVLRYTTTKSRGRVLLTLHPHVNDAFVVPLPAARAIEVTPAPSPAIAPPPRPPPRPPRPPCAPPAYRSGPWLRRLADALRTHHYG